MFETLVPLECRSVSLFPFHPHAEILLNIVLIGIKNGAPELTVEASFTNESQATGGVIPTAGDTAFESVRSIIRILVQCNILEEQR